MAKSTLLEAHNTEDISQRLSANKNARGHWEIEESELGKVFSKSRSKKTEEPQEYHLENRENRCETSALQVEVKMLREQIERIDKGSTRERVQMNDQIANLREQIERQSADHRQALAVVTDQRPTTPNPTRRRFFGLLKATGGAS
ncbi:MAG: hypothetical protein ABJF50_20540 [Paracoccaceae bacterium]|uniref:hypothetical protein n=1 Tax=Alphaproteobacteria TaxID=28211 RepID=UPI00327D353F